MAAVKLGENGNYGKAMRNDLLKSKTEIGLVNVNKRRIATFSQWLGREPPLNIKANTKIITTKN